MAKKIKKWEPRDFNIDQIQLGDVVSLNVHLSRSLVDQFAGLSGDYSPLHIDPDYAKIADVLDGGHCAVHGMLMASYFSTIVGMFLPGKKALIISQNIDYLYPVPVGSTITVTGKVVKRKSGLSAIMINMLIIWGGVVMVRNETWVKIRK